MKRIMLLNILLLLLTACSNSLGEALEDYQRDMSEIATKNDQLNTLLESFDYSLLNGSSINGDSASLRNSLREMSTVIEDEIVPLVDEIEQELETIEITNDEIDSIHTTFLESFAVKQDFINDIERYIELYYQTLTKSEELVRLSQMFIENQEIRNEYIASAETEEEEEEVNRIIDQINENSSELENSAKELQETTEPEDKQNYIDESLTPIIEEHIRKLNEMNLDTDIAIRVRSITLEMYYGYERYYTERRDTLFYNEELERLQIDTILQQINVYEQLESTYIESLEELINES